MKNSIPSSILYKSGVYRIYNVLSNKSYVGSTKCFIKRFDGHLMLLLKNEHHSDYLQNAYNKYGKDIFVFEVLIICPTDYLLKVEQWFFDKFNPSYNICKIAGSKLGTKDTDETRLKKSIAFKGKIISQEYRDKISNTLKGIKHTEERIKNIQLGRNGIIPIISEESQINKTRLLIESLGHKTIAINIKEKIYSEYNSINECSRILDIDNRLVQAVLKNKNGTKKSHGYIFVLKENFVNVDYHIQESKVRKTPSSANKVKSRDKEGNILYHNSVAECCKALNISKSGVLAVINKQRSSCYGYEFKWDK